MNGATETSTSQYLSFALRDDNYAVEIFQVKEILDVTAMTRIPQMPDYLCGVINLRGSVVPVVDLGLKLGMGPYAKTVNSCVMIVEIAGDDDRQMIPIGVLADSVQEVLDLGREDIEPVPKMGIAINTDFMKGIGKREGSFFVLLNISTILTRDMAADMAGLQAIRKTITDDRHLTAMQ